MTQNKLGELMKNRTQRVRPIVRDLIAPGVFVVAGAPKIGKTFWLMQLALSVATGERFLGHFPIARPGKVLYIYAEGGGTHAAVNRFVSLVDDPEQYDHGDDNPLNSIRIEADWPRGDAGRKRLDRFLAKYADEYVLVVIDTLAAFQQGAEDKTRDAYKFDYDFSLSLSQLAHRHRVAIVVAHHDRKAEAVDFLNSVSGTKGLTGGSDGIIVMRRGRNETLGEMLLTARELPEGQWALEFEDVEWSMHQAPPMKNNASSLPKILAVLEAKPMRLNEIYEALDEFNKSAIRQSIHRTIHAKTPRLRRDHAGRYHVVKAAGFSESRYGT